MDSGKGCGKGKPVVGTEKGGGKIPGSKGMVAKGDGKAESFVSKGGMKGKVFEKGNGKASMKGDMKGKEHASSTGDVKGKSAEKGKGKVVETPQTSKGDMKGTSAEKGKGSGTEQTPCAFKGDVKGKSVEKGKGKVADAPQACKGDMKGKSAEKGKVVETPQACKGDVKGKSAEKGKVAETPQACKGDMKGKSAEKSSKGDMKGKPAGNGAVETAQNGSESFCDKAMDHPLPSKIFTIEAETQVTAELSVLSDKAFDEKMRDAKVHPLFQIYRAKMLEDLGLEESDWSFGEEEPFLDMVGWLVWLRFVETGSLAGGAGQIVAVDEAADAT